MLVDTYDMAPTTLSSLYVAPQRRYAAPIGVQEHRRMHKTSRQHCEELSGWPMTDLTSEIMPAVDDGPKGIAGWLLIPVSSIFMSTGVGVWWTIVGLIRLNEVTSVDVKLHLMLITTLHAILGVAGIVGTYQLLNHQRAYVTSQIIINHLQFGLITLGYMSIAEILRTPIADGALYLGLTSFISMITWNFYMIRSRRVKNTFVH